jgi:hypothetical protein
MGEPRSKAARALKLCILSLLPAVVLFGGAETYATLAIQRAVAVETDDKGKRRYTMRIGRLPWSRASVMALNSDGFPEIEFASISPKRDCNHIVFAGDSFVFGDGVDRDSSFVSLIRTWADRHPGHACTRVFNLGERGTTIDKQTSNINRHIAELSPDVVILGQYQNDLIDLLFSHSEQARQAAGNKTENWQSVKDRFRTFDLNVVRFASYHLFNGAIQRGVRYDLLKHWSILADSQRAHLAEKLKADYEAQLVALKEQLAARGVAFGVIILPSKFDLLAGRFPEGEYFRTLALNAGIPYLPIYPILDENRAPNPFLIYDGHLNERGNRLVADAVYNWLFTAQPSPFAELRLASSRAHAAAHAAQRLKN